MLYNKPDQTQFNGCGKEVKNVKKMNQTDGQTDE